MVSSSVSDFRGFQPSSYNWFTYRYRKFSRFFVQVTSVGSGGRCVYSSLEPFKNLRITQWFTEVEGYTLGKVRQKSLIA